MTDPTTPVAVTSWTDIEPKDAVDIDLSTRLDITAPLTEEGERCPWPWEPQQLVGVPLGQYHCGYCGAMVLAGIPHLDYTGWVHPQDLIGPVEPYETQPDPPEPW